MKNKVAIKALKSSSGFKVLHISGEPGDFLREHQVNVNALLLMQSGNIIYKEANRTAVLSAGESFDIPANVLHQVSCTTKSKFFVVMPDAARMRFS